MAIHKRLLEFWWWMTGRRCIALPDLVFCKAKDMDPGRLAEEK